MVDNTVSPTPTVRKMLREQSLMEPCIKNPFTHKLQLNFKDKLKIGFNAVFLLPIRLVCCGIIITSAIIVSTIATLGVSQEKLKNEPFRGWRRALQKSLRYFGYTLRFCMGFHRVKVIGKPAGKDEASVFVFAPHSSIFDAFAFFDIGLPCGVSRIENAQVPIAGVLVKALQPILVTREDSKKREAVIDEIKRRSDPSSPWPQLFISPEGTCTNRNCLITFKPGAFIPGLPVQPVIIKYDNKLNYVTWTWDGLRAYQVLLLTLCQFQTNMEVTFLPVYVPSREERHDPKLFANNVRQVMASYLNIPTTNHTYEDCRLMLLARKRSLPFDAGLIEFAKIKEKLGMNYENCQNILEKYAVIARKSNGKLSLADFCKYLELPPSGPVTQVFNLYDRNKNGSVDFREFLIGLSLLTQPANNEDTIKFAFKLFDTEDKGFISLTDLQMILFSAFSMDSDEVDTLFNKIDANKDGLVTFDEFKVYAQNKPEYAKIFLTYHELKMLHNNVEYERISEKIKQSEKIIEKIDECENETEITDIVDDNTNETLRNRLQIDSMPIKPVNIDESELLLKQE